MVYRIYEALTELTIYFMVIFGPWAFGTTERWAVWTMNCFGYALGALWIFKHVTARLQGFYPRGWELPRYDDSQTKSPRASGHMTSDLTYVLGGLTVALLLYCLTSAVNARASYNPRTASFDYHGCLQWLPHSFDSASSWFGFWTYVALAFSFWSIRDWLQGKSACEHLAILANASAGEQPARALPHRLSKLLTVLLLNGGVLAAECIIQRLVDSPKLLFLVQPRIHQTAITQFGPYAYCANAAAYLNLLWPVCLGFWWIKSQSRAAPELQRHVFACVCLMPAATLMSASRGGTFICAAMLPVCGLWLVRKESPGRSLLNHNLVLVGCMLMIGLALGAIQLRWRMTTISESLERRERVYSVAFQIAKDFGVFGSGPGTYETISELYRPDDKGFWPAQVHNDWLESRITFGLPGALLILLSLAVVLFRWFVSGGLPTNITFVFLSWVAMAGCLLHACFDFPFQVHSILFLFVLLCAILFTVSRRPRSA